MLSTNAKIQKNINRPDTSYRNGMFSETFQLNIPENFLSARQIAREGFRQQDP